MFTRSLVAHAKPITDRYLRSVVNSFFYYISKQFCVVIVILIRFSLSYFVRASKWPKHNFVLFYEIMFSMKQQYHAHLLPPTPHFLHVHGLHADFTLSPRNRKHSQADGALFDLRAR